MLEKGIAFRKKSKVNWCPECATVLANEQVIDGYCWRHETTLVEIRELEQWFLRITQYSDAAARRHEGTRRRLARARAARCSATGSGSRAARACASTWRRWTTSPLEVFTTRIDTIYGATALVLSAGHPAALRLLDGVRGPKRNGSADQGNAAEKHARRGHRDRREGRILHRAIRRESVFGREPADLGGEFRAGGIWHGRGDVRSGARPARLRVRGKI